MDKAKALQHEACLPDSWWEFGVEHALHCYNCTPVMRLSWHIPYEAVHHERPDIFMLRVFGCRAYVYLPPTVRKDKLAPNSELMIHLGVAEGIKGYRFMRGSGRIFTAPDVLFMKSYTLSVKHNISNQLHAYMSQEMSSLLDNPRMRHLHHQVKPFLGTQRAMNGLTHCHYHLLEDNLHPHQLLHLLLLLLHHE